MLFFYKRGLRVVAGVWAVSLLLLLNACEDRLAPDPHILPNSPIYALNDANQLLRIDSRESNLTATPIAISGTNIQIGERIMSIDFRPATGQLYGVSNKSRLFILDPTTAQAQLVTENPFTPGITGGIVGIDFNPALDRIRLVSNDGQDLWLNPETGFVMARNNSFRGTTGVMIAEVAYTNNRAGTPASTLYHIDPATDRLYTQLMPNSRLTDVGALGLDIAGAAGFDITPDGNGVVAVTFNGSSELNKINLLTGRLQKLGNLPGTIIGVAIPTEPVAYAVTDANNLLIFNPQNPLPVAKIISGIQANEQINGISFSPATGQLYALGSTNRLYTLNPANGIATLVSKKPFEQLLSGQITDFHFTAAGDRIALKTNTGQALLLYPASGVVDTLEYILASLSPKHLVPTYTLLRKNDSTRIYTTSPVNNLSSGVLLPGNPVIRGFAVGVGF